MKQAKAEDFKSIIELYSACRVFLNTRGVDQWVHGYPTSEIVRNDIEQKDLWLVRIEDELAAAIVVNKSAAKRYNELSWECKGQDHLEVHRLAVHPKYMNQGLGRSVMMWAENEAKNRGACCIRLDTYSMNEDNIRFYKNLEFRSTGNELFWPPLESSFLCFEKLV
ncbi:MAG: ribosomal protein S18 acetylase RimI-like enzyme [Flavobacteriales bacterium]|jgi:ribosomal protein S18 acetylase RimI-like enzyme